MTQVPPQAPAGAQNQPARKGKGLAVAALILGLIGLVPLLGFLPALIAIVLAIIALATGRPGKGLAVAGLLLAVIGLAIPVVALKYGGEYGLDKVTGMAQQYVSDAQMKLIGVAAQGYHSTHGEWPSIEDLQQASMTDSDMLVCLGSKSGRDVDYFLFVSADEDANPIIATTLPDSLNGGRNVMYLDGKVEFLSESDFRRVLAEPRNAAFAAALRAAGGM